MGGDIYRIISKLSLISNYRPKLQSLLTDPLKPQSLFTVYIDRLKLQSLLTDFLKDYSLQDAETMSDDSLPPLKHLEANRYSNFYSVMFAYFLKAQDKQCQKLNYVEIQHESQDKKDSENVEYPKNINEISPSILNNRESENEPLLENYDTNQTSENIKTQVPNQDQIVNNTESESVAEDNTQGPNQDQIVNNTESESVAEDNTQVPNQDQIVNNTESESVAEDNRESENEPLLENYDTNQTSENIKRESENNDHQTNQNEIPSLENNKTRDKKKTPTDTEIESESKDNVVKKGIFHREIQPAKTTSHARPPPLKNTGTDYYLNSALQGVSSCVKFTKELNEISKQYATPKLEILNQLIGQLKGRSLDRSSYEISRNPIFREWTKPGQQDSFELFIYMINQVYQEIRNKLSQEKENYGLNQWLKEDLPMRITLKYQLKCKCGPIETPFQVDLAFHVPVCGKLNLDDLIENFFDEDGVEGFDCDNCADSHVTRQIKLIKPLPNTLCVHLQRSQRNCRRMEKIDSKITFTKSLHIKRRYLLVQTEQKEDDNETDVKHNNEVNEDADITPISLHYEQSEDSVQQKPEDDQNELKSDRVSDEHIDDDIIQTYSLSSVIVHYGGVYGGHYVCYKKCDEDWYLTNDSCINKTTWNEVENCNPYILFYEKS